MTIKTIKNLCSEYNIRPSSKAGQNFLIDKTVLSKIIATADIKKGENILEIGSGFGVLTQELVKSKANIVAIEHEKRLAEHVSDQFKEKKNLRVHARDIISVSNKDISEYFSNETYRIVANIPYHITGKIIKKFVSDGLPKPSSMILLVQKEVAERICVDKGRMSLLALSVQLYAKPSIAFLVSKKSFWPAPEVSSALLCINDIKSPPSLKLRGVKEERFWQIARIGFSSPRKQLRNNIANGLQIPQDSVKQALNQADLDETSRAQELDINDWIRLIDALGRN